MNVFYFDDLQLHDGHGEPVGPYWDGEFSVDCYGDVNEITVNCEGGKPQCLCRKGGAATVLFHMLAPELKRRYASAIRESVDHMAIYGARRSAADKHWNKVKEWSMA